MTDELKALLAAAMNAFPGDGFIVIQLKYNESTNHTDVNWISSVGAEDTKKVLKSCELFINHVEN